ncbi:glucose 1-dehydrogenase [Dechloromonas agitata]|uniref:SDR family NAD(P)-dependent oxidoreductase n=1 Tax=Dechloromonas agitata TaxID=73030 RepID=UPI00237DBA85|nr:glucose 1-dehydrogenase [Dechloromonas agitata]MDE1544041.1 glucose 1-dehydrogenase [Dechloromonas agitata]
MNRLNEKIVLVTGAARGIGAATASALAEEGAKVLVCDILDAAGAALAQSIRDQGGESLYCHLDVTRENDWTTAAQQAAQHFGGLDVLVNNAGIYLGKSFEEVSLAEWQRLCDINLTGVVIGIKSLLPLLRERASSSEHGGAIVNMSSVAGLVGAATDPLYSLTKGGITLLTKALAVDFGQRGYRLRVNSVHPGAVDTEMGRQTFAARAKALATDDLEIARRQSIDAHPIGRLGTVKDIAQAVVYLASDEASFVTGASLAVDGGFTAR